MLSRIRSIVLSAGIVLFGTAFIIHTDLIATSVRNACAICAETVLPTLFPFLVLSAFIVNSGMAEGCCKVFRPLTEALWCLPGEAGMAVLLGMVGGFPVGPKVSAELYERGDITKAESQKVMLFSMGAGPAFVIGTVGVAMLGSLQAGLLLYASMVFAAISAGTLISALFDKLCKGNSLYMFQNKVVKNSYTYKNAANKTNSIGDALYKSVESGTQSIISICAYIIIFAAITCVLSLFITDIDILNALTGTLEVTRGCKAYSGIIDMESSTQLPLIASIISFGGICVHCQVLSYIRAVDLPYAYFLVARLACALIAALFCRTVILFFPTYFAVFSNLSDGANPSISSSVPACVAMLLLSAMVVLDHK